MAQRALRKFHLLWHSFWVYLLFVAQALEGRNGCCSFQDQCWCLVMHVECQLGPVSWVISNSIWVSCRIPFSLSKYARYLLVLVSGNLVGKGRKGRGKVGRGRGREEERERERGKRKEKLLHDELLNVSWKCQCTTCLAISTLNWSQMERHEIRYQNQPCFIGTKCKLGEHLESISDNPGAICTSHTQYCTPIFRHMSSQNQTQQWMKFLRKDIERGT